MARFLQTLHRCGKYNDTHKKRLFFVGIFIITVLAGAAILPKDKASGKDSREAAVGQAVKTHIVRQAPVKAEDANPLEESSDPAVNQVVEKYYRELAKDAKFVDSYDNVKVYTKLGPYENSYIVFASYEMKIKDIYTEVPGLGTLYIEEGKDGELSIVRHVKDENVSGLVRELMQHGDVKSLTAQVDQGYADALAADATLREAMASLKDAYESTAGTGPVAVREQASKE